MTYHDEETAFNRVRQLRRRGYWPGVITRTDGTWALTFDPDAPGDGRTDQ